MHTCAHTVDGSGFVDGPPHVVPLLDAEKDSLASEHLGLQRWAPPYLAEGRGEIQRQQQMKTSNYIPVYKYAEHSKTVCKSEAYILHKHQ